MKLILFTLCLAVAIPFSLFSQQEENIVYTNNYITQFEKGEKPENLKYQASGAVLKLEHQSKVTDLYSSKELFPRPTISRNIRDFDLSYDLKFTESASSKDFFGMFFVLYPWQGVDDDTVYFTFFLISPEGKFYQASVMSLYSGAMCYGCPGAVKDKALRKAFDIEKMEGKAIEGFKPNEANTLNITRTNNLWVWKVNGKTIFERGGICQSRFDGNQGPVIMMNGKCSVEISNLKENYSHSNEKMARYLKGFKSSGKAEISSQCIKGDLPARYELTTRRGVPSIKLSWMADSRVVTEYFDFSEAYNGYKLYGLSTMDFELFGTMGTADEIRVRPDEGTVSFKFTLGNSYQTTTTKTMTTYSSRYCLVSIMLME